ncbi:MAG: Rieske (2Fe-2S) protein [Nitrososphaerales archaeon]
MPDSAESAQEGFVVVAKANDVAEGSMVGSMASGKPILISRLGGKLYAMDAICSHFYGYLPRGELKGGVVICPVHKAQYDINTGKVVKNVPAVMRLASSKKASDLRTYAVQVVGDSVLVKV